MSLLSIWTWSDLQSAVTNGQDPIIRQDITIPSNYTIPETITCRTCQGGRLLVDDGVTLTVHGVVIPETFTDQVFGQADGSPTTPGTVVGRMGGIPRRPEMFGGRRRPTGWVTGDPETDNYDAILSAIQAGVSGESHKVELLPGDYPVLQGIDLSSLPDVDLSIFVPELGTASQIVPLAQFDGLHGPVLSANSHAMTSSGGFVSDFGDWQQAVAENRPTDSTDYPTFLGSEVVNNWMAVDDGAEFAASSDFEICVRAQLSFDESNRNRPLVSKWRNSGGANRAFVLRWEGVANQFTFQIGDATNSDSVSVAATAAVDYNISARYNGSSITLEVNGVSATNAALTASPDVSVAIPYGLGAQAQSGGTFPDVSGTTRTWRGPIYAVSLFDSVLTAAQRRDVFNSFVDQTRATVFGNREPTTQIDSEAELAAWIAKADLLPEMHHYGRLNRWLVPTAAHEIPLNASIEIPRGSGFDMSDASADLVITGMPSIGPYQVFANVTPYTGGTGATVRGLFGGQTILGEWWGCYEGFTFDPDVDDRTRLQAALDCVPSSNATSGLVGTLRLARWTATCTQSIDMTRCRRKFLGSGRDITKIIFSSMSFPDIRAGIIYSRNDGAPFESISRYEMELNDMSVESDGTGDQDYPLIYVGRSMEEKTAIRRLQINEFPRYGIYLTNGSNGGTIEEINCGSNGYYSSGEKGFFLKESGSGLEDEPRGFLVLRNITHNASGPGTPKANFSYCFRNRGRLLMEGCHAENADVGYWFNEADNPTGHILDVTMIGCDFRPTETSDRAIYIDVDTRTRLTLSVLQFTHMDLGGDVIDVIRDDEHAYVLNAATRVAHYRRTPSGIQSTGGAAEVAGG